MNKLFRIVIVSILHLAVIVGCAFMMTKGNPVFKLIVLAFLVGALWSAYNYYKKEIKNQIFKK